MPQGPGTYGSKVGRPKKKKKKEEKKGSQKYAHGGEVRMADVRFDSKRGKTY